MIDRWRSCRAIGLGLSEVRKDRELKAIFLGVLLIAGLDFTYFLVVMKLEIV